MTDTIHAKQIREAYDFYRRRGHGAKAALDLARCERIARALDLDLVAKDDPYGWEWECSDGCPRPREVLWVGLYRVDQWGTALHKHPLASLGGIGDPDNDYLRELRAELTFWYLEEQRINPRVERLLVA